ncbi:RNA polymerase-associated protein CTR9 [Carex littledalei]|uniref:RNA polymerase-associated protein CTR9 n=1 Tax=Carex littledalei TaxID=544730 RepID=A0A833QVU0_9POAL|nr:RNA polymerase-associated protein CTR9 [Carex littledalei]
MAGSVYIPVQNSEEEVCVALDQLPRDAADILDILKAEQAPLSLWLIIAREYYNQGKIVQFLQILDEGSGPEIDEYYADVKYERISILNALGAYYTFMATTGPAEAKEKNFVLATSSYNRASRIDAIEPSTWIGKALLCIARDELDKLEKAKENFKIVLDYNPSHVPGLLGQACVFFMMGEKEENIRKAQEFYKNALENYKRSLRLYPGCPAVVRLGIGYCQYRLGQLGKARKAFDRVLQLDPDNVEANVALGVMDIQTNEAGNIRRGVERMELAHDKDPVDPMVLNHLGNHFFFTGQHFLVEQLTETALENGRDHPLLKSQAYYNLARSYHSKGDYDKAGRYYIAAAKEIKRPKDFVLPFYGLGQIQLKLKDLKSSLSSFEKVLEVYPENVESLKAIGHIYAQQRQTEKAIEIFKKVTRIDPKDSQAFLELGELLLPTDSNAALEALKTARNLLKKSGEDIPIELLNTIGVLHFEKEDFELAEQTFKEALGDGIWVSFLDEKSDHSKVNINGNALNLRDVGLFHQLEEDGESLDLPWDKVTTLFNYARLLEQRHDTGMASIFYRFIIFKYSGYVDAYLRLAAIAKARHDFQLSIELVGDALKVDEKNPHALCMLADLELKSDGWVKAKDTIRAAKDATSGKDSYSNLALGNWNYFAALRSSEKKGPKLEATHLEKAKELYTKVLKEHKGNMYAANGTGIVLAEKGHFDVSKDLFTQVQEAAASGSALVQMPDVWVNLAHIYLAQGQFSLATKMYQNCSRKFYYGTDSTILLYLARAQYDAEQWQDCKKTLLRALHLAPSNPTLRFNIGVAMQKYSASTLQKTKRTADEIRFTLSELENAVRMFRQLCGCTYYHSHGFDDKKFGTHVEYCQHLLEAAKVHCEAAEREEHQTRQRLEVARQVSLAEEARRKAEEQRKLQAEKRKQEDELKQIKQLEEHFERVKEQWKSSTHASGGKRRERSRHDDEEGGERKRRRNTGGGGRRRKKDKRTEAQYEDDEGYAEMEYNDKSQDEAEEREYTDNPANGSDDGAGPAPKSPDHFLAAAGFDDSDVDDVGGPSSRAGKKRRAFSESDEDEEPVIKKRRVSPSNSAGSDGENREAKGNSLRDDEDDDM